ncbi:hypothetical protein F511_17036 [Dorcoceras hygrometricum]|uniref:Uncharacterized protein n=1 Tax=Dorcoceras hygrometricum TaxID=472368 RepID=A0A2Z7BEF6_9LAMI|nr:hypothetical protein F511_17036 [Dorcoceras hygrometricum]
MHAAVKEHRSLRPAKQLAVISIEPLYPHSVSTEEIIGTTHLSAGHNVALSQALNRSMAQYLTTDCDDITADVIIADPSTDSADVTTADPSCCLLILLTSSSP